MAKFDIGDWCIDTRAKQSVDIVAIIPAGHNSIIDLYIVEPSEGGYYILSETDLIEYNKYYWDAEDEENG
jgi:hypothetical protein